MRKLWHNISSVLKELRSHVLWETIKEPTKIIGFFGGISLSLFRWIRRHQLTDLLLITSFCIAAVSLIAIGMWIQRRLHRKPNEIGQATAASTIGASTEPSITPVQLGSGQATSKEGLIQLATLEDIKKYTNVKKLMNSVATLSVLICALTFGSVFYLNRPSQSSEVASSASYPQPTPEVLMGKISENTQAIRIQQSSSGSASPSVTSSQGASAGSYQIAISPGGSSKTVTIPAETHIKVHLESRLSSATARAGETWKGTLVEDVNVDGSIVAEAGDEVIGKVTHAKSSEQLHAPGQLTLRLAYVNGLPVASAAYYREGKGHTKSNAKIGGGAATGALIGAIVGGGKGAAIGTSIGVGAGTGVAAYTGKQEAVIPAEKIMTFTITGTGPAHVPNETRQNTAAQGILAPTKPPQ